MVFTIVVAALGAAVAVPAIATQFLGVYLREWQGGASACWSIVGAVILYFGTEHPIGQWTLRVSMLLGVGLLLGFWPATNAKMRKDYRLMVRNFYGVLHVKDDEASTADEYSERRLLHGTINHGSQILDENLRYKTTSYYGEDSGVGRAIRAIQKRGAGARRRGRAGRGRAFELRPSRRFLPHL